MSKRSIFAALLLLAVFSANSMAFAQSKGRAKDHLVDHTKIDPVTGKPFEKFDAKGNPIGAEAGKAAIRGENKVGSTSKSPTEFQDFIAQSKLAEKVRKELGARFYSTVESALTSLDKAESAKISDLIDGLKAEGKTNNERQLKMVEASAQILADKRIKAADFSAEKLSKAESTIVGDKEAEQHSIETLQGTVEILKKNLEATMTLEKAYLESYFRHWTAQIFTELRAKDKSSSKDVLLAQAKKEASKKREDERERLKECGPFA